MQDRQLVETVRARVDLIELVGRYVNLRQRGSNFTGCCPFHEEKTPSFTVSPGKGVFHCFGCGAGGDLFKFVERIEKLNFPQALEFLAHQAGVSLPQQGQKSADVQLRELNEKAAKHYERGLASLAGNEAFDYLKARGIGSETAKKFRLGYAIAGWQNLLTAYPQQRSGLKTLGLVISNEARKSYDRFRDRIMFSLCDAQGQVVGFAGRQLHPEEKSPKYVNTPNTPLLKKGTLLYGLYLAQEAARQSETLVLVEGYTDVIAAHQGGVCNTVASMGTALTSTQARLCARYAKRVLVAFDQDAAGQKATLRGIQLLLAAGLEVRMVEMPSGSDPDTLIQTEGIAAFERNLQDARPFFEVYVDMLCQQFDATTFAGKQQILSSALPFLKELSNLHWRGRLVAGLSASLDLPNEEIQRMLRSGKPLTVASAAEGQDWQSLEEHILCFLIHGHLSVERATAELEMEDFTQYGELWEALQACYGKAGTIQLDALYAHVDARWHETLNRLSVSEVHATDINRALEDVLRNLKAARLERRIKSIPTALRRAEEEGDDEKVRELLRAQLIYQGKEGLDSRGGKRTTHD